jgi:hypothetical protein
MITYRKSQPYNADPSRAKDIVLQTLLPLGFQVINDGTYSLTLNGPGYRSTRQSPLLGISTAVFDFGRSQIVIDAELGGLNRMSQLLLAILIGVGVIDSAIFFALWYYLPELNQNRWFLFVPALTLLLWIFIAPLITRFIRRRCEDAIDTLLRNAAGDFSSN